MGDQASLRQRGGGVNTTRKADNGGTDQATLAAAARIAERVAGGDGDGSTYQSRFCCIITPATHTFLKAKLGKAQSQLCPKLDLFSHRPH